MYLLPLISVFLHVITVSSRRVLYLHHNYSKNIPIWPGHTKFNMDVMKFTNFGDFVLQTENLATPSHIGTHLDAPIHFAEGKWAMEEIPNSVLRGPGVVIDVSRKAKGNQDYEITVQDLMQFEMMHGRIPEGGIVFFRTGWGAFWNDPQKYLGDATDVAKVVHPGLSGEAAEWLMTYRKSIVGIGSDTVSLDPGRDLSFKSHVILLKENKWGIENLANLDKLPPRGFYVFVLPMRVVGASGAPTSVMAFM